MKDQLQLQEIAGYLACDVEFVVTQKGRLIEIIKMSGITVDAGELTIWAKGSEAGYGVAFEKKPILRPMSEWRSIEDGTQFLTPYTHSLVDADGGLEGNIMSIPYADFIWLVSMHFDIHNLIGRGLAISIHDIPTK